MNTNKLLPALLTLLVVSLATVPAVAEESEEELQELVRKAREARRAAASAQLDALTAQRLSIEGAPPAAGGTTPASEARAADPASEGSEDAGEGTDAPANKRGVARSAYKTQRQRAFGKARDGRPFGVGLVMGGTAFGWGLRVKDEPGPLLSPGVQVQFNPFYALSIQAGWGMSRVRVQSWWVGGRWLPLRKAGTFILGGGIVGEIIGNETDRVFRPEVTAPFLPYAEAGASITLPIGLNIEMGLDLVIDPGKLAASQFWPFLRVGVLF